jgi:nicotinamide phosphoribosyltransferase
MQTIIPKNDVLDASRMRRRATPAKPPLRFNMVLAADSYKFSHPFSYPKNISGLFSYIEARTHGAHIMIPAGFEATLQRYLSVPITMEDIDEAEAFMKRHGEPFARNVWEHVLTKYHGYLPVIIRAVPEGTPVKSSNIMVSIMCVDELVAENIFWLASFLETFLLRAVWYPTTLATNDYESKLEIKRFYKIAGEDLAGIDFAVHCFGARGTTCHEQAEIAGVHAFMYKGSDTVEGIRYVNHYYDCEMAAFSVPATEHSVATSFGLTSEDEVRYIDHQLTAFAKQGAIISLVADSKDTSRFVDHICTTFHDRIVDLHERLGVKVVVRPDSGDPLEIVPMILDKLAKAFPTTRTVHGYIKLYGGVGILQGDGVDTMLIKTLLGNIMARNYSPANIIFGSGGALLQKVNRDTHKWAQKGSAILVRTPVAVGAHGGTFTYAWQGIAKDPITDPGKKSKEGLLTLMRNSFTGQYATIRIDKDPVKDEWVDVMEDIYDCGQFFNLSNMDQIRTRCAI